MKLTEEEKVSMYYDRQEGMTWSTLTQKYNIRRANIIYYVELMKKHGIEIIRKKLNSVYSKEFKLDCINRVLLYGESSNSVSLEVGLPNPGTLSNWIRSYKENGYNIIERSRGRPSMKKPNKKKIEKEETEVETLKRENEYLKAEVDFLKKWNAVVQLEEKRKKKK